MRAGAGRGRGDGRGRDRLAVVVGTVLRLSPSFAASVAASVAPSFPAADGPVGVAAGSKAPCTWRRAAAAAAAGLRGRRVAPRSALLRPTRLSPSPPPLAAGLERSISWS